MKILSFDEFVQRLTGYANGRAICPGHDDNMKSLSVNEGNGGRILVKCHAGCNIHHVLGSLDLTIESISGNHVFLFKSLKRCIQHAIELANSGGLGYEDISEVLNEVSDELIF